MSSLKAKLLATYMSSILLFNLFYVNVQIYCQLKITYWNFAGTFLHHNMHNYDNDDVANMTRLCIFL